MMIYIVLHKQSLFDIAIQLYGGIAGVFALASANNIQDVTIDLQPGTSLEYNTGDVVNKPVKEYYCINSIIPATSVDMGLGVFDETFDLTFD